MVSDIDITETEQFTFYLNFKNRFLFFYKFRIYTKGE